MCALMPRLHPCCFKLAAMVRRHTDESSDARATDGLARLGGCAAARCTHAHGELLKSAAWFYGPRDSPAIVGQVDFRGAVHSGESAPADCSGHARGGEPRRHIHADRRPARWVVPLNGDAVGRGAKSHADHTGQGGRPDGFDVEEAAADDRPVAHDVRPQTVRETGRGFVGIDQRVDEQSGSDSSTDTSKHG
jgi:hypothetical protein